MPSALETTVNRRQTEAFIAYDARTIVLQHAQIVPTAAGGRKRGDSSSRAPQTARLTPRGDQEARVIRLVDGEEVDADYVLVMRWDAIVERGDWFYLDGLKYEIGWVNTGPTRHYETKCEVALRG